MKAKTLDKQARVNQVLLIEHQWMAQFAPCYRDSRHPKAHEKWKTTAIALHSLGIVKIDQNFSYAVLFFWQK